MNNKVRHDIYLTLLQGGMKPSDKEDSGTQLSWLSSNIKQIENLGWEPFFKMTSEIAMIILCTVGLLMLHWTLLAFTVVAAVIMLTIPKLFDKKIENLGKICTEAEAKGLAQMKNMLFGLNVLRSFGKIGRFLSSGDEASNIIENPNAKRKTTQTFITGTLSVLSVVFQILQVALVVFIALQGKVIMGAMASALIHDRSILLVDEGTSALDKKNADIVEQSLLNNPDLTLILVSHHLTQERKEQFTKVFELTPVSLNPQELP